MTKRIKIIYWIATIWLALGMLSTGLVQLLKAKEGQGGVNMITHLGYPVYLLTLLAVWKVLGVIALLIPKYPLVKEWAYAGFFFLVSGAIFSHLSMGDDMNDILPSLLLMFLTVVSWYSRPATRKMSAFPAAKASFRHSAAARAEKKIREQRVFGANS